MAWSPPASAVTAAKVKKIVKKQIKKLVPGMIDAATIDQATIPPLAASTTDPNETIFTAGPFTLSLDCSEVAGDVNLQLLVRTTEENSVASASSGITGDLDPADGDQAYQDYLGNPPGGEAFANTPYYDSIYLRSPSGTHVYVQLDSITNFMGNHCYVNGWFLELAAAAPAGGATLKAGVEANRSALSSTLTGGKVKKLARKQIKKVAPGMIDAATLDQGIMAPVSATVTDPTAAIFSGGPFTVSMGCSLDGGNVRLTLLARTTEEDSVVNDAMGNIGGDLDPGDGDQLFKTYLGNPPGGDAVRGDPFDTRVSFRSPSGTHFELRLDSVTNFMGNHCYVDGWFVDLTGTAPSGVPTAKLAGATSRPVLAAAVPAGKVKKIARKQIKKRVPKMIDAATFDQGTIPLVTASITDPNRIIFARGPFTITVDCSLETTTVDLSLLVRTTEENSVVSSGWGFAEEIDPSEGDVLFAEGNGNAPGGEADTGSEISYQDAVFHSPGGAHFYAQFDAVTNYRGNHCFVDGWFFDLAG
jgi:hypothetical protein